jgi:hypothetical protein
MARCFWRAINPVARCITLTARARDLRCVKGEAIPGHHYGTVGAAVTA